MFLVLGLPCAYSVDIEPISGNFDNLKDGAE